MFTAVETSIMKEIIKLLEDCKHPIELVNNGNHDESELLKRIDDMIERLSLEEVSDFVIPALDPVCPKCGGETWFNNINDMKGCEDCNWMEKQTDL